MDFLCAIEENHKRKKKCVTRRLKNEKCSRKRRRRGKKQIVKRGEKLIYFFRFNASSCLSKTLTESSDALRGYSFALRFTFISFCLFVCLFFSPHVSKNHERTTDKEKYSREEILSMKFTVTATDGLSLCCSIFLFISFFLSIFRYM